MADVSADAAVPGRNADKLWEGGDKREASIVRCAIEEDSFSFRTCYRIRKDMLSIARVISVLPLSSVSGMISDVIR
jgi:hypothetical protein